MISWKLNIDVCIINCNNSSDLFLVSSLLSFLGISLGSSLLGSGVLSFFPELEDVRLILFSDNERGDIDDLSSVAFVNCDFLLEDEGSGLVKSLGIVALSYDGLESSVQKLFDGKTEDVIQFLLVL